MPITARSSWFLCLFGVACASSQYPSLDEPLPPPEPATAASAKGAERAVPGKVGAAGQARALQRADVERVVDSGLGRLLTHVALEPRLVGGKFMGWSIVRFSPPEWWSDAGLQPGDVVTKVNGLPIEREMQAFDAFQAVRHAPALEIDYLRDNQPRSLRFEIIGAASPSLPQAPAAAEKPAAANP